MTPLSIPELRVGMRVQDNVARAREIREAT